MTVASFCFGKRQFFPDAKQFNHALFGAWYEEDIYDNFCARFPHVMRAFWWRIAPAMRARALIFVHVPRAAGTSIMHALYGEGCIHHYSMRYYCTLDPDFAQSAQSFALLRDPFDRFASAYAFVRAGGTATSRLSTVFVRQAASVRTVEDYLCFLEGRGSLEMDFVMRPQSWFVCDLASGAPLVKDLFVLSEDTAALAAYLAPHKIGPLPWLNRSRRTALLLTARQRSRIERLYAADFALIDSVRSGRAKRAQELVRSAAIAAE